MRDGKQVTEFQPGILTWALQRPCALVFDEYDAGRADVMFVIQRVLELEGRLDAARSEPGDPAAPGVPAVRHRQHRRPRRRDRALSRHAAAQPGADGPLEHRRHAELPRARPRGRRGAGALPRVPHDRGPRAGGRDGGAGQPDAARLRRRRPLHRDVAAHGRHLGAERDALPRRRRWPSSSRSSTAATKTSAPSWPSTTSAAWATNWPPSDRRRACASRPALAATRRPVSGPDRRGRVGVHADAGAAPTTWTSPPTRAGCVHRRARCARSPIASPCGAAFTSRRSTGATRPRRTGAAARSSTSSSRRASTPAARRGCAASRATCWPIRARTTTACAGWRSRLCSGAPAPPEKTGAGRRACGRRLPARSAVVAGRTSATWRPIMRRSPRPRPRLGCMRRRCDARAPSRRRRAGTRAAADARRGAPAATRRRGGRSRRCAGTARPKAPVREAGGGRRAGGRRRRPSGYRAYTTAHDRVVNAAALASREELAALRKALETELTRAARRGGAAGQAAAARADGAADARVALRPRRGPARRLAPGAVRRQRRRHAPVQAGDRDRRFPSTVVTLLIDHSGSMRGPADADRRADRRDLRARARALRRALRGARASRRASGTAASRRASGRPTATRRRRAASTRSSTSSSRAPTCRGAAPAWRSACSCATRC